MKRFLPPEAEIPDFPLSQLNDPELRLFRQDIEHRWAGLEPQLPQLIASLQDCANREEERRRTNSQDVVLLEIPAEHIRGSALRRALALAVELRNEHAKRNHFQLDRLWAHVVGTLDNQKRILGNDWDSDSVADAVPVH